MKIFDFNLNEYVLVKLTDIGKIRLEQNHKDLKISFPKLGEYKPIKEDIQGYSRWQMHNLMSTFGDMVHIGHDLPFETNIKIEISG